MYNLYYLLNGEQHEYFYCNLEEISRFIEEILNAGGEVTGIIDVQKDISDDEMPVDDK